MLYIGNHLSISDGFVGMLKEALELGGNTFAFFTRNPRGGKGKIWDLSDIAEFEKLAKQYKFGPIVAHAPYTYNPCSLKEEVQRFAYEKMAEDIEQLEKLSNVYYNFHPGSHVGRGVEEGIEEIAKCLNTILKEEQKTIVLLETMAGKGSEVGKTFEEIKAIMDKVILKEKLGVCLDTCHIWDGGYNIVENLDFVLEEFDRIIGLKNLKAIHLNDSKNSLASHKDRHEQIGKGHIGLEALVNVINHKKLQNLPFILETPNDFEGYKEEIALLRENYKN